MKRMHDGQMDNLLRLVAHKNKHSIWLGSCDDCCAQKTKPSSTIENLTRLTMMRLQPYWVEFIWMLLLLLLLLFLLFVVVNYRSSDTPGAWRLPLSLCG